MKTSANVLHAAGLRRAAAVEDERRRHAELVELKLEQALQALIVFGHEHLAVGCGFDDVGAARRGTS